MSAQAGWASSDPYKFEEVPEDDSDQEEIPVRQKKSGTTLAYSRLHLRPPGLRVEPSNYNSYKKVHKFDADGQRKSTTVLDMHDIALLSLNCQSLLVLTAWVLSFVGGKGRRLLFAHVLDQSSTSQPGRTTLFGNHRDNTVLRHAYSRPTHLDPNAATRCEPPPQPTGTVRRILTPCGSSTRS